MHHHFIIQDANQHEPASPPPIYRTPQPSSEPGNPFSDHHAVAQALNTPSPAPDKKTKVPSLSETPCEDRQFCASRQEALEWHKAVCNHDFARNFIGYSGKIMLVVLAFSEFFFSGWDYLHYPTHNPDGRNITYIPLNSTFEGTYTTWNGTSMVNRTVTEGHTAMEGPTLGFFPIFTLLIATIVLYRILEKAGGKLVEKTVKALWKRRQDAQYRHSIGFMLGWEEFQNVLFAVLVPAIMYGLVVGVWYSETRNIWKWTSHPAVALQGRGSFRVEHTDYIVPT